MSGQHGGGFDPNQAGTGYYHATSTPGPSQNYGNVNPNTAVSNNNAGAQAHHGQLHGGNYIPGNSNVHRRGGPRPAGSPPDGGHQPRPPQPNYPGHTNYPNPPIQPVSPHLSLVPDPYRVLAHPGHAANTAPPVPPLPIQPPSPPQRRHNVLVRPPGRERQPRVHASSAVAPPSQPYSSLSAPPRKEPKELPTKLKGTSHVFNSSTATLLQSCPPYHCQPGGYTYSDQETQHRHRDAADRVKNQTLGDMYLLPDNGYLSRLVVQSADELFEGPPTTTWWRTYIRKVAPWKVRAASWVVDYGDDPDSWEDWFVMLMRAIPAALVTSLCFWDISNGVSQFNKYYAPINYKYHGDAKVWANGHENGDRSDDRLGQASSASSDTYRLLRPRDLCFLRRDTGVEIAAVDDWEREHGEDAADLRYLFIAYSSRHFNHGREEDMRLLHKIAERAARDEGIGAYWVACSCMRHEAQMESDVYRISDVVRGAQKMIIALPSSKKTQSDLLREWGSRMWTFPEILLSPGDSIALYTPDSLSGTHDGPPPAVIHKNQFAARAWPDDADVSRLLTDHYLGKTQLSRLELAVFGLQCLWGRGTSAYLDGDQAYALMGLLRARPRVVRSDSAFQAFARLSLANDSDRLLERLVCTMPKTPAQPWYDMSDKYGCALWDINPVIQVAGICDNDSVIVDGAYGGTIQWDTFMRPWQATAPSIQRRIAKLIIENNMIILTAGIILLATSSTDNGVDMGKATSGVMLILVFLISWVMTPKLVRIMYGGKFRDVQAMFFGFEGYVNKAGVERAIFGANFGRLAWSVSGSPLCRSENNEFGERVGVDPLRKDRGVRRAVEAARSARPGDVRVFTLVDTYNMEMMLFEAVRPPVSLLLCGVEGGMQRAVGCSYEWTTGTLIRETVLRMPTTTLNRMERVPRFRFGMRGDDMNSKVVMAATPV